MKTNLIGKICKCAHNQIGIVTFVREAQDRHLWYGINLYTGGAWQSRNPEIVADGIDEWVEKRYVEMLDAF
jgi:hypothetical protein